MLPVEVNEFQVQNAPCERRNDAHGIEAQGRGATRGNAEQLDIIPAAGKRRRRKRRGRPFGLADGWPFLNIWAAVPKLALTTQNNDKTVASELLLFLKLMLQPRRGALLMPVPLVALEQGF